MKKIVLFGASAAAVTAIEEIRGGDQESEITLFSFEGCPPYDPQKLADFVAGTIEEKDVFLRPQSFYDSNRVHLITDQTITRLNVKRNKIHTEEKNQYDFDTCVITDVPDQPADIKGVRKEGVFNLSRFSDARQIKEKLPFIDIVAIQSDEIAGLQWAKTFLQAKKEVYLILKGDNVHTGEQEAQEVQVLTEQLKQDGLNVVPSNGISELLGDREVMAVRLNTKKIIESHCVLLTERREDFKLFSDSPLLIKDRIWVDESFKTNLEHVFALGRASQQEIEGQEVASLPDLEQQGRIAGARAASQNQQEVSA